MRNSDQFKALVYSKAAERKIEIKRKRIATVRGIATLSLVIVIGASFVYGNLDKFGNKEVLDCAMPEVQNEVAYLYSKSESFPVVCAEDMDGSAAAGGMSESDTSVQVFDYSSGHDDAGEVKLQSNILTDCIEIDEEKAVEIATSNVTVEYDTVDVSFDDSNGIWKIMFCTSETAGGCQTVYIDMFGNVIKSEYGE